MPPEPNANADAAAARRDRGPAPPADDAPHGDAAADPRLRPRWQRVAWGAAGGLALAVGLIGIFLPLLPTTPFVIVAAFCLSRSSARAEAWLLDHPRLGPVVRDWREHRAIPLRAKQIAWASMAATSVWAWWVMPLPWRWLPGAVCAAVAWWMVTLPTRPPRAAPRRG